MPKVAKIEISTYYSLPDLKWNESDNIISPHKQLIENFFLYNPLNFILRDDKSPFGYSFLWLFIRTCKSIKPANMNVACFWNPPAFYQNLYYIRGKNFFLEEIPNKVYKVVLEGEISCGELDKIDDSKLQEIVNLNFNLHSYFYIPKTRFSFLENEERESVTFEQKTNK